MGNLSLYRKGIAYLFFYLAVGLLLLSACAAPSTSQLKSDESKIPVIESIKVQPSPDQTIVEIISSKATPYTTFELMDPPRIILDIRGVLGEDLKRNTEVNDGNVEEIRFEKGVAEAMTTRVVVSLARAVDHQVSEWDNVLTLTLTPKKAPTELVEPPESQKDMGSQEMENAKKAERTPAEPRIFFKPRPITLNQVLGVDYSMLKTGKSRLTVTADKKVRYQLERKGPKSLLLTLEEATIPPLLMRRLDSSYFEGTVDRVKASFSSADKIVTLAISLREMVPFHVKQKDAVINMEFGRTSIKPPDIKVFPVKVSEKEIVKTPTPEQAGGTTPPPEQAGGATPPPEQATGAAPPLKQATGGAPPQRQAAGVFGLGGRKYTGEPMTLDFVNADITNILRLIAEISNLNIIWGPQVSGTVSMRLKNVPWDQALDLVLTNNKLGKRKEGNVIWITTKAEIAQIEAEERQKKEEIAATRQREMEESLAQEKREPHETHFITINYKDVNNIMGIIDSTVKSAEGKLTVDSETKTIIYRDTISKIKEAEALVKRLDTPTPQVMIEARVVEATLTFSRSLGIDWNYESQRRQSTAVPWNGTPVWAEANTPTTYPFGGNLYNPTFQTNTPAGFASNLGLIFSKLGSFGLSGTAITAQIALAETNNELKTLSAPKIVTRDTVAATITQGTQINVPSGTDANGNTTFTQVQASLTLTVTPTITPNNMVIMQISVNDDSPDFANASAGNIPIKTKRADTTMMVRSGETVVIGGIYKETDTDNLELIPVLSKIPLLGWLFKTSFKSKENVELLIFITPSVLPDLI